VKPVDEGEQLLVADDLGELAGHEPVKRHVLRDQVEPASRARPAAIGPDYLGPRWSKRAPPG
jgi:hypothetical protein